MSADKEEEVGCDELLLSSSEYVGECRVTLLRPLSMTELSSASISFEVVSGSLYTEFVLMSCVGHELSNVEYGLMILAGVPDTCEHRERKL